MDIDYMFDDEDRAISLRQPSAVEKQVPVAYRVETSYEQPFYLYTDTLPTRGKWDALYTAPQPCPECDEKQSAIDVWEGRYADKTAECEKLKAKIDLTNTLAQQSNQDHLNVRKDYQGEIIKLKAERDELAAQVEKMNGVIKAAYEIAVDHDDQLPFDWAVYCEMLYQAMQDGDLSTGILNRVRAEALDAKRYQWLRSSSVGPAQIWELLSDDCSPPVMTLKSMNELDAAIDAALAADMEAGK